MSGHTDDGEKTMRLTMDGPDRKRAVSTVWMGGVSYIHASFLACVLVGGWVERLAVRPAPCYFTRQSNEPGLTIGTYARCCCCCCCSLAISVECYEVCVYICSLNIVRAVGFGAIAVLLIGVKRSTQTDTHTHGGKKGKHRTPRDVGAALRKQSTNTREINNVLVCAHTHIFGIGGPCYPVFAGKNGGKADTPGSMRSKGFIFPVRIQLCRHYAAR